MQSKICRNCDRSFKGQKTKLEAAGYCSCACRRVRESWMNCAQCLRNTGVSTPQVARIFKVTPSSITRGTKPSITPLAKSLVLAKLAKDKKNRERKAFRDRLFAETGYRTTPEERRREKETRPPNKKPQSPESRKRSRIKYLAIPENRLRNGLRRRLYKAVKTRIHSPQIEDLTGCSLADLRDWIESQFKEGMTWGNYGIHGWHIDHIQPCSSFDHGNPDHVRRCWHFTNLRPMWAKENIAKGAKITEPQMQLAI